ncbi:Pycsar system effector family protein [Kitasatospora sp. NPDC004614]|uniref:Pycsar system effector family protein n=1 Tax=unclassified Kitasatospora TaxID=2633591 RepID=UPI0036741920
MERLAAANSAELGRADAKAAVLLGFTGAAFGAFLPLSRDGGGGSWPAHLLWWTTAMSALLAVACFVAAIVPRRRRGRSRATGAPGYFEHITAADGAERLGGEFEASGRDPGRALLSSLIGTSAIIRSKYRWIEAGTTLLLLALMQFGAVLRPV